MSTRRISAMRAHIINNRSTRISWHIYLAYAYMYDWGKNKLKNSDWEDITAEHFRLITNLCTNEILSNAELARRAGVTKQAMSHMVNLLEQRGFITVEPFPGDARSKNIHLSDKGVEFMFYFANSTKELTKQFTAIVGTKKMQVLTDIMRELSDGLLKVQLKK